MINLFSIIAAIVGFVVLVAGVACIYWPAGLIVCGLLLLLAAHGSTRMPARKENLNGDE